MDATISIRGLRFDQILTRADGVSVYRGEGLYLRIGPAEILRREISFQRRMLGAGFPVAGLIEEGEYEGRHFVIEASLGLDTLGDRFDAETTASAAISDASFEVCLAIVLEFARAQLMAAREGDGWDAFRRLLRVNDLATSLPDLAQETESAFEAVVKRLSVFPSVLTHGDFHAFNICERGVIDLETVGWGPAGYDVITAVLLPDLFPPDPHDYGFSADQRARYLQAVDELFVGAKLPAPSVYLDEFRLCKAIWLTARRERPPTVLAWLDNHYRDLLGAYSGAHS